MTMDPDELASILKREAAGADNYYQELSQLQHLAFRAYEADENLVPFLDGRSRVTLPDVQTNVDYMHQSVLRTFVSGDRTVEFEASDEVDEDAAAEATSAIDYIFMRKQDGYRILSDGLQEGLLYKIGVFKTVMEEKERVSRERVTVDPLLLGELPDEIEVEDLEENEDGSVTCTLKRTYSEKVFVDYALPRHEFRFSPRARHEDEADYLAHVKVKTRSDLVEMGFDADQVAALPKHGYVDDAERYQYENKLDDYMDQEASSPALEEILLHEEYARVDVDGDGIAERIKTYRVENTILVDAETKEPSIETVDEQPFSLWSPYPRSNHLVGYSLCDKVMDIMIQRTFIARQMFDGIAFSNMPRTVVDTAMMGEEGAAETYSDLMNPIPGSPIRARGGASAVQPLQSSFRAGESMQVLEWVTGEGEARTGITRMNQGLDADALNKTATGTALMQASGQQQEEYVARNFAECIARLMRKKYRLMRSEGEPFSIKVDGTYKQVNPQEWPEGVNVQVRVGLGTNSKDKRVQARFALAEPMRELAAQGLSEPKHIYNWLDGLVRDLNVGQASDFMSDPEAPPEIGPDGQPIEKQEEPSPEEQAMMAEQQAKQAEMQMKQQEAAARLQLDQEKAQSQIQLERDKAAANIEVTREKGQLDMQLSRERAEQEAELGRERMIMEARLKREQMVFEGSQDADLNENREGGRLDA